MTIPYDVVRDFWDYRVIGEIIDPKTGKSYGRGVCGLRDNAPESAVKAFNKWFNERMDAKRKGIML